MWPRSRGIEAGLRRAHFVVPTVPGGGRKLSPNSVLSHEEVWAEAGGLAGCPGLTQHSPEHTFPPAHVGSQLLCSPWCVCCGHWQGHPAG